MAVFKELSSQGKLEFSRFNINIKHSGKYSAIQREISAAARNVYLIDHGEDEIEVVKDGVTQIAVDNFTLEELALLDELLGKGFDRAVNGEYVDWDTGEIITKSEET